MDIPITSQVGNSELENRPDEERAENAPNPAPDNSASITIPDGGIKAWLVVVGSTAAITASFGIINSVGTFQVYLATHQLKDFSSRDVAWIPALNLFLCLFLGVQFGPLFDRYGPRWLLATSSVVFLAGLVGMSFINCSEPGSIYTAGESVRTYVVLMITWGVLCGSAAAVITTVALAVLAHWFDARRGLATGIAYAGSSIGGIIFPLLMRSTLPKLGWDWTVRIIMFIILALLIIANACIRGRTGELDSEKVDDATRPRKMKVIDLSCFRDARFTSATIGISVFEFVVSATVGILPTWGTSRGFDEGTAFAVLAVYNAGSFLGRILAGAVSDHFGSINTIISVLVISITFVYSLWLPVTTDRLPLFYVFALMFGFSTGSIMSMAPVCLSKFCNPGDYGRYLGTSYSLVSFFCFVSIPASAAALNKIGAENFSILFGAFLAIALVAFVIARWTCLEYRWRWKVVI